MAYTISKDDIIKQSTSGIELSDNLYSGTIVGYMVSKKPPFNGEGDEYFAVKFAIQIKDDADKNRIVQTNDMRISLSEKSTLFKQLSGWVKAASPTDLWERLEKANFMDPTTGNLNFDKFLGVNLALITKMVASKKDASKMYPDFTFAVVKKGQEHQIDRGEWDEGGQCVPIWIPDFVKDEDLEETSCLEGFEYKRYEKKEDDQPKTREERVEMKPSKQIKAKIAKEPEAPAEVPSAPAPTGKTSERLMIRRKALPAKQEATEPAVEQADDNDMPF